MTPKAQMSGWCGNFCAAALGAIGAFLLCEAARAEIAIDPSLVLPYRAELEQRKPLTQPYVATFRRDGKTLRYVAVEHISAARTPDLLQHPTLKTIAALVAANAPRIVIVEGLDTGDEIMPASVLPYAQRCAASRYAGDCGESAFVINQALSVGAAYVTGEPSERALRDEFLRGGRTPQDLLGFYLVRQIPPLKRRGVLDRAAFQPQAEQLLAGFQRRLGLSLQFGFAEFFAWYAAHMPDKPDVLTIENNDTAPEGGPGASYAQILSHEINTIRDRAIVARIAGALERYGDVLIAYGGSHLVTQEPALTASLGAPVYAKLF